ncbi:MAG: protein kinase [Candidatus Obscuribacterales bacterium]|nr:protein kinase [Candidatus Obscuribacterales bacterium]
MEEPPPLESLRAAQEALPPQLKLSLLIGEGGGGVVYKARHLPLDIDVAVKVLKQSNPVQFKRFQVEAANIAQLDHPNIVKIRKFGVEKNNSPFIVCDFIDGETLAERLSRGPVNGEEFRDIFVDTLKALEYAHSKGIIHRDLKPSNIMLCAGDAAGVKLVDFGISKNLLAEDQHLTGTQDLIGTPQYMSPEQCTNASLDAGSDIYSIACIMYETICGQPPFAGESALQTVLLQSNALPPSLVKQRQLAKIPGQLLALIDRGLAKTSAERPSVAEMLKTLQDMRIDWSVPHSSPIQRQEQDAQRKLPMIGIAVSIVGLIFWGLIFIHLSSQPPAPSMCDGKGSTEKLRSRRQPKQRLKDLKDRYMSGFTEQDAIQALNELDRIREKIRDKDVDAQTTKYWARMLEGMLREDLKQHELARALFVEASQQCQRVGSPAAVESLFRVAEVETKLGNSGHALTIINQALALKEPVSETPIDPIGIDGKQGGIIQRLHHLRSTLYLKSGKIDSAEADLIEVLKHPVARHIALFEVVATGSLAEIVHRKGRHGEALDLLDDGRRRLAAMRGDLSVAEAACSLSNACVVLGKLKEAEGLLLLAKQKADQSSFVTARATLKNDITKRLQFVRIRLGENCRGRGDQRRRTPAGES